MKRNLEDFANYLRKSESEIICESLARYMDSDDTFQEVLKEREAKNEFYEALAHEQEMKQQALTSSEIIGTIDLKDKKKGDEE